jgi:single-strand selective monofunctional uracil DNA glycosylase
LVQFGDSSLDRPDYSCQADIFLDIELELADGLLADLSELGGAVNVTHVSNPLRHALVPHTTFLRTYLGSRKKYLFLGMNPGPWGMCQTGVPFGEVGLNH